MLRSVGFFATLSWTPGRQCTARAIGAPGGRNGRPDRRAAAGQSRDMSATLPGRQGEGEPGVSSRVFHPVVRAGYAHANHLRVALAVPGALVVNLAATSRSTTEVTAEARQGLGPTWSCWSSEATFTAVFRGA